MRGSLDPPQYGDPADLAARSLCTYLRIVDGSGHFGGENNYSSVDEGKKN